MSDSCNDVAQAFKVCVYLSVTIQLAVFVISWSKGSHLISFESQILSPDHLRIGLLNRHRGTLHIFQGGHLFRVFGKKVVFLPTVHCSPFHKVKSFFRKEFQSLEYFLERRIVPIASKDKSRTRNGVTDGSEVTTTGDGNVNPGGVWVPDTVAYRLATPTRSGGRCECDEMTRTLRSFFLPSRYRTSQHELFRGCVFEGSTQK